jgi:predicted ATP-dependent serine protease
VSSAASLPGTPCPDALCGGIIPAGKTRCPSCRAYAFVALGPLGDEDTVLLSDARVSEVVRIPTGILDDVFGGGLVITSVNLIAGPPGAGKTTLFLQLADIIAEHYDETRREVLYIANEQEASEIKTTAKRIEIKHLGRIRIVKAMGGLRRDLGSLLLEYRPAAIILDSLTKLSDDPQVGCTILERLKSYAVELLAPCLVVNQINKDGDHAGLQKLQHAVDAVYMLDKDDTDGSRFFYSTKNRFGEAPKGIELLMTPGDAPVPGKLMVKPKEESKEEEDDGEED